MGKFMTPFGLYVRTLRLSRQISMKAMAEALGVSASYLSLLEQGKRGIPNTKFVDSVADYFELNDSRRNELNEAASDSQSTFEIPLDAPPEAYRVARLFAQCANRIDLAHLRIIQIAIEAGQKNNNSSLIAKV